MTLLEFNCVKLAFGHRVVLDGCSLQVAAGEIVALAGPNGAGKTTLLSVASGHCRPDSGEVLLLGRPVGNATPESLARLGLRRCFQGGRAFASLTVAEHLALARAHGEGSGLFARPAGAAADLVQSLELAACAGRPAGELSVGQCKLLDLGRALAGQPRLLLLDEPFAGVSAGLQEILARLLLSFCRTGGAVLLIEHELAAITRLADRLEFMADGRILCSGPPAEVLARPEVREMYLGLGGDDA